MNRLLVRERNKYYTSCSAKTVVLQTTCQKFAAPALLVHFISFFSKSVTRLWESRLKVPHSKRGGLMCRIGEFYLGQGVKPYNFLQAKDVYASFQIIALKRLSKTFLNTPVSFRFLRGFSGTSSPVHYFIPVSNTAVVSIALLRYHGFAYSVRTWKIGSRSDRFQTAV